jgi:transcriptional regulator with XRE-family HTH domain
MNYVESIALKSHRKRSGFTQEDVAILIGVQSASQVSRHESGEREPDLRAAIAYRIVLDAPFAHLLPKLFREIAKEVEARASQLAGQLAKKESGLHQAERLELLRQLTARIAMDYLSA